MHRPEQTGLEQIRRILNFRTAFLRVVLGKSAFLHVPEEYSLALPIANMSKRFATQDADKRNKRVPFD